MPISTLATLLVVMVVLVGLRIVLFKLFKPSVEPSSLPAEMPVAQREMFAHSSGWPAIGMLGVVVLLVVALVAWGSTLGG